MVEDDDDEEEEGDFEARRGEARSCPTGEARTCSRGAALKSVPIVEGEAGGTSVAMEPHERGWGLWSWGAVSRIIDGVPFPPPSGASAPRQEAIVKRRPSFRVLSWIMHSSSRARLCKAKKGSIVPCGPQPARRKDTQRGLREASKEAPRGPHPCKLA